MIVTISRIQHRQGLEEDLPQLAAGELGWAVDSRRLFIGNGSVDDGAPPATTSPNNTEILTEWSLEDLLNNLPLYTYVGNSDVTVISGVDAMHPVQRTMQARLDDYVSVKAFGATGDGSTDDVDAINRALYELYCHDNTGNNNKILFFPAGVYLLSSGYIKIPKNARIAGEGKDCTFIRTTETTLTYLIACADSLQQVDSDLGTNGATHPANNKITGITFEQGSRLKDLIQANSVNGLVFDDCKFTNLWDTGNGGTSGAQAINIKSTITHLAKNIAFKNCEFSGFEYINTLDYDAENITFDNCRFELCYSVSYVGQNLTGSGVQTNGPLGYRIINSHFNQIYASAIKTFQYVNSVVSANNFYGDVGNTNGGITGFNFPIISFSSSGNISIGDFSQRADSHDLVNQVDLLGTESMSISPNNGIFLNRWQNGISGSIEMPNDTSTTSTGIERDYSYWNNLQINYRIKRDTAIRSGTLYVSAGSGGLSLSDDFIDSAGDIGVTFSIAATSGTNYEISYVTTNTGFDAVLDYQINVMR